MVLAPAATHRMNTFTRFFQRTGRERALFFEALLYLAWAKILVRTLPFRRLAARLGQAQRQTPETITPRERALAVDISWAVQAAARHVPLGFVCLPQAIAAHRMLRRRGLPATLYLGVASDPAKREILTAHAWLRAGDKIVTGENEIAGHVVVATFASDVPAPSPG